LPGFGTSTPCSAQTGIAVVIGEGIGDALSLEIERHVIGRDVCNRNKCKML
jgi:hypothetical protein